jgi:hypothetical protein
MLSSPSQPTGLNYHNHLGHSNSSNRGPLDFLGRRTAQDEEWKTDQQPRAYPITPDRGVCYRRDARAESAASAAAAIAGVLCRGGPERAPRPQPPYDAKADGRGYEIGSKGSRKNKFPEFALRFAPDSVATIERIRRRSRGYVEEFAIEERPEMA